MQKILLAFFLVACAGAERDADAANSLATLLLSRNPAGAAFNPSAPAARLATKTPTVARSRPVAMKADDQKLALTPALVNQAAAALAAMMPLMALADDDLFTGITFVLKLFSPFIGFVIVVTAASTISQAIRGGDEA
mmetsp:Transcript_127411/g.225811  ORF Transcript_127411/g.225811 Transcript_127411/m.225811 type:complete len:137 (+) Transcript_127411:91-501(+)